MLINELVETAPTVSPDTICRVVKERIGVDQPIGAAVVVQGSRPVGLVMSIRLDRELSQQFGVAVYYDRPISLIMDPFPLILDQGTAIEDAAKQAMARERTRIYDHVIVTRREELIGVVTVQTILNRLVAVQQERATEMVRVNQQLQEEVLERKRAEKALLATQEKYRDLFENVSDFLYVHDLQGNFLETNLPFKKEYGFSKEGLVGLNARDLMPEEYRHHFDAYLERILQQGEDEGCFRFLTADGRTTIIEYRNSLVLDAEGDPVAVRGSGRDATERLKAEKEKKALQLQLQRAQKMEAIGTLAGGVAHDLNNVLSGVVSYPDFLLTQLPPDDPFRRPIEIIKRSGEKGAAIVQDLLDLARRGVVTQGVLNINEVITDYLESPECEKLRSFFPGVHIRTRLEPELLNIMGSPLHLSKTVMNLVSNAVEAIKESGTVTLSTENRCVERSMEGCDAVAEGDYAVLTVADTGIGISPEDQERIFEPFYTKKKMGRSGTGLGMAVVWGTVKDHNGSISIHSREGEGTTLTLLFPATRMTRKRTEVPLSPDCYRGNRETVLVVDDIEEQREIASTLLSSLNYEVSSVASGEEALRFLDRQSVDILVLDMIMEPGIDGLETFRRIQERHPGQRAVIASGFSETDRVREAQKLGAGAYIKKPYTLAQIGMAVKEELDRERPRKA